MPTWLQEFEEQSLGVPCSDKAVPVCDRSVSHLHSSHAGTQLLINANEAPAQVEAHREVGQFPVPENLLCQFSCEDEDGGEVEGKVPAPPTWRYLRVVQQGGDCWRLASASL